MHDRTIVIPTQTGQMETFITHPEQGGPFPAVVIYMDFWGLREELFDIARVGTVGYTAWCLTCTIARAGCATNGATTRTR
jgi:dienelactone hydrolase